MKYLCCTASSCCKLSDLADRALLESSKPATTLQTCTSRVSIAPVALVTVVSMVNHILPCHHLPQWKQEKKAFCLDLAFHHIRLYLSKPCQTFSSISVESRVGRFLRSHQVIRKARVFQPSRHKKRRQQQKSMATMILGSPPKCIPVRSPMPRHFSI